MSDFDDLIDKDGRLETKSGYPATRQIRFMTNKTSHVYVGTELAGKESKWYIYIPKTDTEEAKTAETQNFKFSIVGIGFKLKAYSDAAGENWSTGLIPDSRVDQIRAYKNKQLLFPPCLYKEYKEKYAAKFPAKFTTCFVVASLTDGTMYTMEAGSLLTKSFEMDAKRRFGMNVKSFDFATKPLAFVPVQGDVSESRRKLNKEGVAPTGKDEVFFLPIYDIGVLHEKSDKYPLVVEAKRKFDEWVTYKRSYKGNDDEVVTESAPRVENDFYANLATNSAPQVAPIPQEDVDDLPF